MARTRSAARKTPSTTWKTRSATKYTLPRIAYELDGVELVITPSDTGKGLKTVWNYDSAPKPIRKHLKMAIPLVRYDTVDIRKDPAYVGVTYEGVDVKEEEIPWAGDLIARYAATCGMPMPITPEGTPEPTFQYDSTLNTPELTPDGSFEDPEFIHPCDEIKPTAKECKQIDEIFTREFAQLVRNDVLRKEALHLDPEHAVSSGYQPTGRYAYRPTDGASSQIDAARKIFVREATEEVTEADIIRMMESNRSWKIRGPTSPRRPARDARIIEASHGESDSEGDSGDMDVAFERAGTEVLTDEDIENEAT